MTRRLYSRLLALFLGTSLLLAGAAGAAPLLVQTGSIAAPINVVQMAYSAPYGKLLLRNSASAVAAVDTATGATISTRLANTNFTDISLTPDQRYLYAADYGGTNIGYGTPSGTQYVHRYDVATNTWETKTTPAIAYHVQAVDDGHLILAAIDQWITFSYEAWGTGSSTTPLGNSAPTSTWPGYYAGVYEGNIQYDPSTGRLIHGNSNDSSEEIQAFRLSGNDFVKQEGSGIYGSAQGYGGTTVLSTDDRFFYYGRLQVDALDVTHNLRVFPEAIIASTGSVAISASGNYYDAETGALLGNLGFATSAVAANQDGQDLWAYDSATSMLVHFAVPEPSSLALLAVGLAGLLGFSQRRSRKPAEPSM